jgi:F-type H+-transporting ATPase subunit c
MRKSVKIVFWGLFFSLLPMVAFAAEEAAGGGTKWEVGVGLGLAVGAGLAVGLAGLGCGIGQGLTAGNTTAGIARNPGAAGSMFTNFILAMVLIESIAIYGLVVALLLYFHLPALG